MGSHRASVGSPSSNDDSIDLTLKSFRLWAAQVDSKHERIIFTVNDNEPGGVLSRTRMWKAYYGFLSGLLQHDVPYPPSSDVSSRVEQAIELRRVETNYENELLRTIHFPDATESNQLVEDWVEQVMHNWEVLCGPDWRDDELGEGGQNAVGRNVLDVSLPSSPSYFRAVYKRSSCNHLLFQHTH